MNKQLIYLTGILVLAMAASLAAAAQETNAGVNNTTLNNTTLNNTILDNTTAGMINPLAHNSTIQNDSKEEVLDIGAQSHAAQNLSTVNNKPIVVAPISEMAGVAPLVTAGASSAQAPGDREGAYKIGTGVGGSDPFNPVHPKIAALELDIAAKPMRDTGKMFFVCNIV